MLRDPELGQELGRMRKDLDRGVPGVKLTKQAGDCLHNEGIGFALEMAAPISKIRHKPQPGEAPLDAMLAP